MKFFIDVEVQSHNREGRLASEEERRKALDGKR
jgi:hypothetical protein